MRSHATDFYATIMAEGLAPSEWRKASETVKERFRRWMYGRWPYLRLAEGHWKVYEIAKLTYSQWFGGSGQKMLVSIRDEGGAHAIRAGVLLEKRMAERTKNAAKRQAKRAHRADSESLFGDDTDGGEQAMSKRPRLEDVPEDAPMSNDSTVVPRSSTPADYLVRSTEPLPFVSVADSALSSGVHPAMPPATAPTCTSVSHPSTVSTTPSFSPVSDALALVDPLDTALSTTPSNAETSLTDIVSSCSAPSSTARTGCHRVTNPSTDHVVELSTVVPFWTRLSGSSSAMTEAHSPVTFGNDTAANDLYTDIPDPHTSIDSAGTVSTPTANNSPTDLTPSRRSATPHLPTQLSSTLDEILAPSQQGPRAVPHAAVPTRSQVPVVTVGPFPDPGDSTLR